MNYIRKIQTHDGYEACVDLQKAVWGFADRELVPSRTMIVAQKHGGCVLGAFAGDGRLVGFALSYASFHKGRFGQHSSMLAVLPEFRDQGLGRRLKLAQREDALERRIAVVTWTFDPLEARNAHLNLNKLGAVAAAYHADLYPQSASDLYSGLGTDRCLVEWWIGSARVRRRLDAATPSDPSAAADVAAARCVNYAHADAGGLPEPGEPILNITSDRLLVEIPSDISQIKRQQFELAQAWRENTRQVFRHYLAAGYRATQLLFDREPAEPAGRRAFYLLEKGTAHED